MSPTARRWPKSAVCSTGRRACASSINRVKILGTQRLRRRAPLSYLRIRRTPGLANTPALWLGDRGKELAYYGLRNALQYRAELAGIKDFHPHLMRPTPQLPAGWQHGGSEGGLMAVAGWATRDMIDRYTRAGSWLGHRRGVLAFLVDVGRDDRRMTVDRV